MTSNKIRTRLRQARVMQRLAGILPPGCTAVITAGADATWVVEHGGLPRSVPVERVPAEVFAESQKTEKSAQRLDNGSSASGKRFFFSSHFWGLKTLYLKVSQGLLNCLF